MRTERLKSSSPELDAAEVEWWDRFAPVSERIWTLDPRLSKALRRRYLERAAAYLGEHVGPGGVVLDLGCGSGTTSRALAASGMRVVGVDSSAAQIEIARRQAARDPNHHLLSFEVADVSRLADMDRRFDGVVAHAFLHHLTREELAGTIGMMARLLNPAGRAWLYEPVFFADGPRSASARAKRLERGLISLAAGLAERLHAFDEGTMSRLSSFNAEAERRGYFLSPKELPFTAAELLQSLRPRFTIDRARWENTTSYQLAAAVSLMQSSALRRVGGCGVAAAAMLDSAAGGRGTLEMYTGLGGYGFASVSCSLERH